MTTRNNAHARAGIDAALAEIGKTSGHTPGPWVLTSYGMQGHTVTGTISAGTPFVANLMPQCDGLAVTEHDARLIAAAPDLLAALVKIIEAVNWMNEHALPAQAKAVNSTFDWQAARAAIAKAKGVQS